MLHFSYLFNVYIVILSVFVSADFFFQDINFRISFIKCIVKNIYLQS